MPLYIFRVTVTGIVLPILYAGKEAYTAAWYMGLRHCRFQFPIRVRKEIMNHKFIKGPPLVSIPYTGKEDGKKEL